VRVLVCGGRRYDNDSELPGAAVAKALDGLAIIREWVTLKIRFSVLMHGACGVDRSKPDWSRLTGADRWAHEWALRNRVPVVAYPADWTTHKRAAGPMRNEEMIIDGRPDLVIAFPGGDGTAGMVELARKYGVSVEFPRGMAWLHRRST